MSARHVLLGVTGSVAAVKAPELCEALLSHGVSVDVVLTESAVKLLQATYRGGQPWEKLLALTTEYAERCVTAAAAGGGASSGGGEIPAMRMYRDSDEWAAYGAVGSDPVLHIELAKRNRLLLIAPLCANTLASCALGLCGSLLGSVVRAWYYDLDDAFAAPLKAAYGPRCIERPFVVAPAMNTFMWHQRVTSQHVEVLAGRGVHVVPPVSKTLACGDTGMGAMASVEDIVQTTLRLLEEHVAEEERARREGKPIFTP
eukprot:CAMPEP_0196683290 /NCGR_PEP_ID=MMETSP1090-20130531/9803_1 /TAXON_ID=37098 /ORGANISM="Isochrysis sp, Strain CCMP1244" /LENGTH=257 /DNA_ID=CAMNT_0042021729 /DNA_START=17 /DNA_END=790 /DNA_ORIENTATION=+